MLLPVLITPVATAPVSLVEVRAHLRIDHTDEDPTLQAYIDAATDFLGGRHGCLGKLLATQTWQQAYPVFTSPMLFPDYLSPVQAVDQITYYDAGNLVQTLAPAVYSFVPNAIGGAQIVLNANQAWPSTYTRDDAVLVDFIAGYEKLPPTLRHVMLLLIGDFYANREASSDRTFAELPYSVRILLSNFRTPVM